MAVKKPTTRKKTKALALAKKDVEISVKAGPVKNLDSLAAVIREKGESAGDVRRRVVELLRSDPAMVKFVRVADALPFKRTATADVFPSLDLMAQRSGIRPAAIVGALATALCEYNMSYEELAKALAYQGAPAAVRALTEQATKPARTRDREILLRMTRHLPVGGGGAKTLIQNSVQASAKVEPSPLPLVADGLPDEPGEVEQYALPPFEDSVKVTALAIRNKGQVA